jgi:hypothetical protein
VSVGFEGNVPVGSATISGRCYKAYQETDGTTFVPMGVFTAGTCYKYEFGDMSVRESCRACRSLVDECADRVQGCRSCSRVCTYTYTVVGGDSCWDIANDHGMTLDTLLSMNPGLNCEPLQINQQVCLAQGDGQCTNLCEGTFV